MCSSTGSGSSGNITVPRWLADYNDPDNFLYAALDWQAIKRG